MPLNFIWGHFKRKVSGVRKTHDVYLKMYASSLIIKGEVKVFLNPMLFLYLLLKFILLNPPDPSLLYYWYLPPRAKGYYTFLFAIFTGPNKVLLKYITT